MPTPFSVEDRAQILAEILAALEEDAWIEGAIVVGSGSVGFEDQYSDLDIADDLLS